MSPARLRDLESTARRQAVSDALLKIQDFVGPMNLKFPAMRCMTFREEARNTIRPQFWEDIDEGVRRSVEVGLMSTYDGGDWDYGYEIEKSSKEVFGLEPQSVVVQSQVEGDWTVVERDVVRTLLGILF